ncbi:MAG: MarR family transcriptional regulator, partial [Planctomycetes bacterium]|nr:MarR family transcriptional regulator [Planctomycetota bacterium]
REIDRRLREHGEISIDDYSVLIVFVTAPRMRLRMTDLGARQMLTPSGITRLVTRLEDRGLLQRVPDPGRYGVAELKGNQVVGIEEKPKNPKSDYAVIGVYIYPPDVFEAIRSLKPSARGELEITDVNNYYLQQKRMGYTIIDGYWTDAGTLDSLAHANQLVRETPPQF